MTVHLALYFCDIWHLSGAHTKTSLISPKMYCFLCFFSIEQSSFLFLNKQHAKVVVYVGKICCWTRSEPHSIGESTVIPMTWRMVDYHYLIPDNPVIYTFSWAPPCSPVTWAAYTSSAWRARGPSLASGYLSMRSTYEPHQNSKWSGKVTVRISVQFRN